MDGHILAPLSLVVIGALVVMGDGVGLCYNLQLRLQRRNSDEKERV
jgi:hypothetical protein